MISLTSNSIEKLRTILKRKATIFHTGGRRPLDSLEQSWIGRVTVALPAEEQPIDVQGNAMAPIMQLYLPAMPFVPQAMRDVKLLTVFLSPDVLDHEDMEGYMCIREYTSVEDLVEKDFGPAFMHIKAFPLFPELLENDYPVWDGEDIPEEYGDAINNMDEEEPDYFEDIVEGIHVVHKIGGYPSFIQSGIDFGEGCEFVFQIASDAKAGLNIVDGGCFYFAKHQNEGAWRGYFDFY
ncbi:DUF1963 domain-containing protein [Paenibacillus sp. CMAA1739]|uniref:DUF1963 domain-containing protein n=1 Tax=Paenibacillus ottowii TaxID=2315729 RepID=UPI002DBB74EB|nr:DUF1963 domain-containing protein [Paenibacillus sp. CMAA1739]MEC4564582.1 DUF1963 domain-containing protein [Paenibacillus sp. CMAA1739]